MTAERLQKILAQAGYGSRRSCEEFLTAGRVRVNGQLASLGQKADPRKDKISVDGKVIPKAEPLTYIALYKPRNVLSASEGTDDRQTVRDLIPVPGHLYPVGRLDFDSEGLILMTNDGELTNKLTHPRYGHEKEYRVLLARRPDEEQLATWRRGVVLADGDKSAPANVHIISTSGKGAWIRVVMGEGKKRQIREIGGLLGLPVVKIIRMRIGTLRIGTLKPRQWRYLTAEEVEELKGEAKSEFTSAPRPRVKRFRPGEYAEGRPRRKTFEMPSGRSTPRSKPSGRSSGRATSRPKTSRRPSKKPTY